MGPHQAMHASRNAEPFDCRQIFEPCPSDMAVPGLNDGSKACREHPQRWKAQERRVTFCSGSESPEDETMLDMMGQEFSHNLTHSPRHLPHSLLQPPRPCISQQREPRSMETKEDESAQGRGHAPWSLNGLAAADLPSFTPEEVEMLAGCVSPHGGGSSKSSFDAAENMLCEPPEVAAAPASTPQPRNAATSCIARCTIRRKSSLQPPLKPDWTSKKSLACTPLAADPHAARQLLGLTQEGQALAAAAPSMAPEPSQSGGAAAQAIQRCTPDPAASLQQQQQVRDNGESTRRSFGATSSTSTHARRTADRTSLTCLPTDMKAELELLQQALSIPSSLHELPCTPMTEMDQTMLSCLHKRGKGGRNPSSDARLDPSVDPKKATRIMANRMSAARSKLKQKLLEEGQRVKADMLMKQKARLLGEMAWLQRLCTGMEAANQETLVLSPRHPVAGVTPSGPTM